jgi:hypothetical protein
MEQGTIQGSCDWCKVTGEYNKVRAWQVLTIRGGLPNFDGRYCSPECAGNASEEINKVYFNYA